MSINERVIDSTIFNNLIPPLNESQTRVYISLYILIQDIKNLESKLVINDIIRKEYSKVLYQIDETMMIIIKEILSSPEFMHEVNEKSLKKEIRDNLLKNKIDNKIIFVEAAVQANRKTILSTEEDMSSLKDNNCIKMLGDIGVYIENICNTFPPQIIKKSSK